MLTRLAFLPRMNSAQSLVPLRPVTPSVCRRVRRDRTNSEHQPLWVTRRDRFLAFPYRVPASFRGRGSLRQVPLRGALAAGLCLPRLRHDQGVGPPNQAVDLGMRRLRQTDLGDRRDHHAPLQDAADHLVLGGLSDSNGISALQMQRQLGLGSYRSAWLLCGKLRHSMLAPGRSALAGLVEVDETEIPCRGKNDPLTGAGGRSHQGKMLIVGAVEVQDGGAGPGRIRLNAVPDYSADSLHPFIAGNLAPGATAKTDGWSAYPGAPSVKHDPHVVGQMAAHIVLPWVHRIFSNLKVWALGVYHGLRRKHLQSYLDEFVFRFNRRRTRHAAFRSLLGIAAGHQPPATKC